MSSIFVFFGFIVAIFLWFLYYTDFTAAKVWEWLIWPTQQEQNVDIRISYILSILTLLLAFSFNVSATRQARDIIIIDKVEHRLNKVLLYQLDSVTYDALGKKLEFNKSSHSANWKGHIATFEVRDNKLFLNSIKTSKVNTDFNGLLDKYLDRKGRVFASWVSDTLICGTGD